MVEGEVETLLELPPPPTTIHSGIVRWASGRTLSYGPIAPCGPAHTQSDEVLWAVGARHTTSNYVLAFQRLRFKGVNLPIPHNRG